MKKLLFIFIAFLSASISYAQFFPFPSTIPLNKFNLIDSAKLKFTYDFTYKTSLNEIENDNDNGFLVDKQILLVGKNASKYYSQYYFDYCDGEMKQIVKESMPKAACGFEVFKNYPVNKVTVTEQAGSHLYGGNYIYNEDKHEFKWNIDKDTTSILGYTCQKATTTFRGRNYIAWFALDIPSNNGLWKFGGLPGLILKISDDKHNFSFECSGIQQLDKPESIKLYTLNYTKTSRIQMDKLYRRFSKDNIKFFKEICPDFIAQVDVSKLPKWTYNPIELE